MDNVDHPFHYNIGNIETFDYICEKLEYSELRGYIKGQIIRYISREHYKGKDEDLRKAQWYLNKYLEIIKEKDRHNVNSVEDFIPGHLEEELMDVKNRESIEREIASKLMPNLENQDGPLGQKIQERIKGFMVQPME